MTRLTLTTLLLLSAAGLTAADAPQKPREVVDWLVEPLDAARDRVVPLKLYLPETDRPVPVVLFSHGLGGSRNNNSYLGKHWAAAGYAAVFIQHAGSDEEVWKSTSAGQRMQAMQAAASAQSTQARYADVPFVIDQLEKWNQTEGNPLHGKLDLEKIGMSGHSFGAVTTQGLMGQAFPGNRSVAEPRLKAFFPMSPSSHRTLSPEQAFGGISKPVLCMTGTEDRSPADPRTTPESRRLVYAAMPAGDKYQLVFEGGEHHVFGDRALRAGEQRDDRCHPAIQRISTAVWDAYLKGDAAAKAWLQSDKPKTELGLLEKDVWEWK